MAIFIRIATILVAVLDALVYSMTGDTALREPQNFSRHLESRPPSCVLAASLAGLRVFPKIGLDLLYHVARANLSAPKDLGVQAAPVNQGWQEALYPRNVNHVPARLAELDAAQRCPADAELAPD